MSRSSVSRFGFLCLLLALVGLSLPGCSKQGEGERCDREANGDADCDEGLVCKSFGDKFGRCCPLQNPTDARCNASVTSTGGASSGGASSGGTNSSGAASGGASTGGTASGGTPTSGEGGSATGGADSDTAGAGIGGNGG